MDKNGCDFWTQRPPKPPNPLQTSSPQKSWYRCHERAFLHHETNIDIDIQVISFHKVINKWTNRQCFFRKSISRNTTHQGCGAGARVQAILDGWSRSQNFFDAGAWNLGYGSTDIVCEKSEFWQYYNVFWISMDQIVLELEPKLLYIGAGGKKFRCLELATVCANFNVVYQT